MENKERKTRKTVRTFALASFLNDMGSDIIYPIWPLFVTQVLKANMAALGFLDGLGEALVSLSQALSGYFSDKIRKRKIFIWIGYLCGGLSRLGYAISTVWPHLIPFRVLDRAGKIRSAPRDAIIADLSTDTNRGGHFGLMRAMDNAGAVVGVLICIAFVNLLGYRLLFALAAIPGLAASLLILTAVRERKAEGVRVYKDLSLKDVGPNLKLYIALNAVFALGAFTYSFLIIYARKFGFAVAVVPVLYLIYSFTASILSIPFGRLSDKIGRKPVLFVAYAFWAAVCMGVVFARSYALIVLVFVFYGVHKAALDPVQRTLVCELSPLAFRASCLGGFQMIIGLCALPASLIAGVLWESFGTNAPFYFSLGLTLVAGILLIFVKEKAGTGNGCPA
ncbi:MAG TPA: MFS transporter [Acidobacteriota bacterium]|nr:MFS transporter [Acidobacteriota bacterium]